MDFNRFIKILTNIHIYIHTYIHAYIYTDAALLYATCINSGFQWFHTYLNTHIRIYMHAYTHTYTCTDAASLHVACIDKWVSIDSTSLKALRALEELFHKDMISPLTYASRLVQALDYGRCS